MDELVTIVNSNDEVIGSALRSQLNDKKLIFRVSALWITNSKGDILLAKRSVNKDHNPGKWSTGAAGVVSAGESYEETIIREAEEELGLKDIKLKKEFKSEPSYSRRFTQWFSAIIDLPVEQLKLQKEEVSEAKWFTREELIKLLEEEEDSFTKGVKINLNRF